jgi:hypothetical protein
MTDGSEPLFAWLDWRGHEPLVEHLNGTLRFEITDHDRTDGRSVRTKRGDLRVSRERVEADCVVRGTRALLEDLNDGRTNGITAVLRGELMLDGDPKMRFPTTCGCCARRGWWGASAGVPGSTTA